MSDVEPLLSRLRAAGVQLWVHAGQLRVRAPSGDLDPAQLFELRQRKSEIIAFLEQPAASRSSPLATGRRPARLPLSYAQEALWFIDQLGLVGPAYNSRNVVHISGPLDVSLLERALAEVVRRHELLRTRYPMVDGAPTMVIDPPGDVRLGFTDLSALPDDARQAQRREILHAHATHVFDLAGAPPLLVEVVRSNETEHLLILTVHHIAIDGSSLAILFRELDALYAAFARGEPSPLSELPAQFADYTIWERQRQRSGELDGQLAYWRARLAGAPESLDLPLDHVRPAVPDFEGAAVEFVIAPHAHASLAALARSHDTTLFTVLLAAFHALLSRWSGQEDVCIGLPVDARSHRDAEPLIGYFLNTIVLRAEMTPATTFIELLEQVKRRLLEGYEHRDLPFEHLVSELRPERQLARQPLVQVMFAYLAQEELRIPGMKLTLVEAEDRTAKFDLLLFTTERAGALTCAFEYSTSLFERETIERLVGHFTVLLERLVAAPLAPIRSLPLLSARETRQLLVDWNDTQLEVPRAACVHELFEAQVARTPDAVALIVDDRELSYRELNARANQLARHLRRLGVVPDTLVGIFVERSLEMVVGIVAILKAGGAYVPFDPAYPTARLADMLADSGARVLLTQTSLRDKLATPGAHVVCLDADWSAAAADSPEDLQPAAGRLNLAYCLYTSGSTGRPKGVALQHASVVAFLGWARHAFSPQQTARVLFATSMCFDLSVFELFAPLVAGGAVILVRDALALIESPIAGAPVLLNTVPSSAQALLDANAIPDTVRVINLAGEPLRRELARALRAAVPGVRVYNLYGPTEYTVYTTWCEVDGESKVTIGRPTGNTRIYILDRELQPVPIGVAGEIHVAGPGLARGYWKRPELTAERFIPDPFESRGGRMYRTGDLARYLPDGEIEFLGRIDHQVKIRGFRIELGEIESALRRCSGVLDAVVIAREDAPGERRLVAYVVAKPPFPAAAEVQATLTATLPEFMLPSSYVFLESLPLHPNGKLDRKALPAPEAPRSRSSDDWVAPRTPTEELLATIWAEVLRIPRVGIHDNFFELGGHSLLVTQVVARVRRTLRREILVRELFTAPTVAELARLVGSARATEEQPIARSNEPLVASFAQQRMWFLNQLEPDSAVYNTPATWRLRGPLDVPALERAINEVVRRHDVMRTTYSAEQGTPTPVVHEYRPFPLDLVDVSAAADREAAALVALEDDAAKPFDLAAGPLFRTCLVRLAEDEHIVQISLHHIVADGWSIDVILTELGALYGAFTKGLASPLPELAIQYADFAAWQTRWLRGDVLADRLGFWRRVLAGAPNALELPTDRVRPPRASYRGGCVSFDLTPELSQALRELSQREQVTLFMTMAAAFDVLLHRYSGQDDFCVGYSVGNRNRVETEALVGVFVNTLVLRARIAQDETFASHLARVRESILDADAHQDLPFEKLVEELRPERDLSRHPIFQVTYLFSTTHGSRSKSTKRLPGVAGREQVTLPGLDISLVEPDYETAKFDLSLFVSDTGAALEGDFEYASDLFDRQTIERMVEHFKVLLAGIVASPRARIAELPLVSETERRSLVASNELELPERCLHQLFEAQAASTPFAVALVGGGHSISYRELNERANRLARHLRRLGVVPDMRVAVCVDRSPEMVVAVLAVLKAGAAYLPLDGTYPPAWLAHAVEDSGAAVLLTETKLLDRLPRRGPYVVCLDAERSAVAAESGGDLANVASPLDLSYCLYTSGSTGRPKAVALQHASVVSFLEWAKNAFSTEDMACVVFATSLCFDLSIFELFAPLVSGGSVLLVRDALSLADSPLAAEPSLLNLVPSAAQALLDAGAIPKTVRVINLAGEPLRRDLVQLLRSAAPGARIYNLYGPTESTTYASWCEVDGTANVTVGSPLPNTNIYVLDESFEPVPAGVKGQVCISGTGLARGYWGRPASTAERFVPDPFGEPGARMYLTGDLGRRLSDGSIELLGRMDHQVKVRGHRIELAEIEAALAAEGARQPVVLAREDTPGAVHLVAYLLADDASRSEGEWRDALAAKLPGYMVPTAFVFLDALPLTPNKKVDRRALPAWDAARAPSRVGYVAPRTPTEELLAEIWAEVLKIERIGVHDDFFALGGHSLLATQVAARVRRALRRELAVRELFSAPTVARLARVVADASVAPSLPIGRVSRSGDALPASFAQQRLWFLSHFDPRSSVHNMPGAWRIRGPVDVVALQRSLDEVVRRHEILRTTFAEEEGRLVQVIHPPAPIPLPIVRVAAGAEAEAQGRELIQAEGGLPFDLARGPLFRARLLEMADDDRILLLTLHHAISDGWSMGVLLDELCTLYDAFTEGKPARLSELPIQYADFASWQRQSFQGARLEEHLAFWKRALEGAPHTLELPTDRPRPRALSYRGAWIELDLDASLSEGLRRIGQRFQVTPFMILAAALAVLLHRYGDQDDLCIGYPVANRSRSELEGLIGVFVNLLVLRTRVASSQRFEDLLYQVRASVLEADAHQDLPFERLVEELRPERDPARHPLFQVALSYFEQKDLQLPGLHPTRIQPFDRTSKFDLTLFMAGTPEGLQGGFEYSTDLFDRATMERFACHLRTLLETVTAEPGLPIGDIPFLGTEERRRLLVEWNDTAGPTAPWSCLHEAFAQRAARSPDAIAVEMGGERLRRGELDARANQLARELRARGIVPEAAVALCVERSLDMVVAALGILKAGGACVPLDPDLPAARLAYMAADSGAAVLLTQERLRGRFGADGPQVICIDAEWPVVARQAPSPISSSVSGANLAYCIYTSGSTGAPKAVELSHRGLANLVDWHLHEYRLTEGDRTSQVAGLSFDASVWEIWTSLAAGACLHLIDESTRRSPARIVEWFADASITHAFLPTPIAEAAFGQPWPPRMALRALLTGGDVLHHHAREDGVAVINHYGPTEASVVATAGIVDTVPSGALPSIGRPIRNTRIYILDRNGEPVPIGVAGELYIGGAGLARGYRARPSLTAARFVPDPFSGEPGGRLYATGDRARYRRDGTIEFLGRTDGQVKLRGLRIELGEIEAALASHPSVRECAVVGLEAPNRDKQLVAYVVSDDADARASAWRAYLAERLPEPMIPPTFVVLEALPRLPSGKVDRRSLPAPVRWGLRSDDIVQPRSPVEATIAAIWSDLLGLDDVGVEDNFFALGGQSLLVIQVIARIRAAFGIEPQLKTFFDRPTVAALAQNVEALQWLAQGAPAAGGSGQQTTIGEI